MLLSRVVLIGHILHELSRLQAYRFVINFTTNSFPKTLHFAHKLPLAALELEIHRWAVAYKPHENLGLAPSWKTHIAFY
jgi:hypothetical protein